MDRAEQKRSCFRARWVVPVDGPPIDGGALVVRGGRIIEAGPFAPRAGEVHTDLGDVIVVPGFVNSHTHLELGFLHDRISPRPLFEWFGALMAQLSLPDTAPRQARSVREGADQSLAAGVTCIGDISRTGASAEILAEHPIRKVCFVELISGGRAEPNDGPTLRSRVEELGRFADGDRLSLGLSPHAPYSVTEGDLRAVAELSRRSGLPVMIHALESREEIEWLRDGTGPAAEHVGRYRLGTAAGSPRTDAISLLDRCGLLSRGVILAHVNYATDADIARLARCGASVVWCPRTHDYFGHPPHRWRDMRAAGINVCVGTDSLAGAPSLSILEEVRHVAAAANVTPATLNAILVMGTLCGARALGLEARLGSLSPGKAADFTAVKWDSGGTDDPITNLLRGKGSVVGTWLAGKRIFDIPPNGP